MKFRVLCLLPFEFPECKSGQFFDRAVHDKCGTPVEWISSFCLLVLLVAFCNALINPLLELFGTPAAG